MNNAWVKFKVQNAYNCGIVSESVASDFVELVNRFKNRNNYYAMPGDFDDRFSETLKNIFDWFYMKEVEEYAKKEGIEAEPRFIKVPGEKMAELRARALNNYVGAITRKDYGRTVTLTGIAGEDIAEEIYELILKQNNENALKELNEQTRKHLNLSLCVGENNNDAESEQQG